MRRRKVCLLGAPAVGKTSLVRRFVESMFSEDYLSTVGVKVDRKTVHLSGGDLTLLIWDIHGEHGTLTVLPQYLRGAAAHLVVVDAARAAETEAVARQIIGRSHQQLGSCPYVLALNKADLIDDWSGCTSAVASLADRATTVVRSSAKSGAGVDDAFTALAMAATN